MHSWLIVLYIVVGFLLPVVIERNKRKRRGQMPDEQENEQLNGEVDWFEEADAEPVVQPVRPVEQPVEQPVSPEVQPAAEPEASFCEENGIRSRLKRNPKDMILLSEILKPKFKEL